MDEARREIMERIRSALDRAVLPGAAPERPARNVPRPTGGLEAFIGEVEALDGRVIRVSSADEVAQVVAQLCMERGWREALAWEWAEMGVEGLEEVLRDAGVRVWRSGVPADLAHVPVGITGAEAGLADTGTLVLRSGPGRSSLASVLPAVHVALLDGRRVYPDMQGYFDSLPDAARHIGESSNVVFISGPSRTADIEQRLTLGVHGPGELIVVVWG